jgi:predicted GNAT family N-acyltransferase
VYVLSNQEKEVIGFYSLSAMSFSFESLPENLQHRLPHYPVPAVLIGRLAVTKSIQNQGFGCRLLMDALTRILLANQSVGIYSALVDAKDNNAKSFYEKYGFIAFKDNPFKLFLPLKTLQDSIIL